MKISILIAVDAPGAQLDESLAGVRAQAHTEWEVIVGSTPAAAVAAATLRAFSEATGRPVIHHLIEGTPNVATIRNQILALATGDPVAFLTPGDTWTPRHLSNALNELAGGADLAISDVRTIDRADGDAPVDYPVSAQLLVHPVRTLFARDAIHAISSVVFKREGATRVGGFDEHFHGGGARDFCLRCALQGLRFGGSHRATCLTSEAHDAARSEPAVAAEDAVLFYEKHRDLAAVPSAMRRRLLAASLVTQGKLLRSVDPARAARCFWRAWSLQPVHVQTLGQFALTGWRSNSGSSSDSRRPQNPVGPGET